MLSLPLEILEVILVYNKSSLGTLRLVCDRFRLVTQQHFLLSPRRVTSREVISTGSMGHGLVMYQNRGYSISEEGIKSIEVRHRRTRWGLKRTWRYKDIPDNEESRTAVIRLMDRSWRYNIYLPDNDTLITALTNRASRLGINIHEQLFDVQVHYYNRLRKRVKNGPIFIRR